MKIVEANPPVIKLDTINIQHTGDTIITYESPFPGEYMIIMEEKSDGKIQVLKKEEIANKVENYWKEPGNYTGVDALQFISDKVNESTIKGQFRSEKIGAGEWIKYSLYTTDSTSLYNDFKSDNFNPDFFRGFIVIYAIATEYDFRPDFNTYVFGTYVLNPIFTKESVYLEAFICKKPPAKDENNFLYPVDVETYGPFNLPLHYQSYSKTGFYENYINPLLPGNDYYLLLRLYGEKGVWQCLNIPFTTKKRRFELYVDHINMINNGGNESEAEFRVKFGVKDGNQSKMHTYTDMDLAETTKFIDISWFAILGPRSVQKDDKISFSLLAEESDSPDFLPGIPEFAIAENALIDGNTPSREILPPTGKQEQVAYDFMILHIRPVDIFDKLEFYLHLHYSIHYV
jgi:hypothetical protein